MYVGTASGSGRSQASQSRPGKRCTVTSQAVPTPRIPVRSATPARSKAVSRSAAGSTLAASPSHSAASPRNAMTASEASGATTSPAAAKSTTTDHRGALPKARRAGTSRGRGRAAAALTGFAGCRRRASPVETDLVDELARLRPRLGDLGERHRVGLQLAERAHEGVDRNAGSHRILVIHVGEDALGAVRGHELDELHGIVAVRRVLGDDGAGHVHMRAAVLERRQDDMNRLRPFLLLGGAVRHQADIVLVAEADIADAGGDVLRHVAVAAGRLLGEVGLDAAQPFLGPRLAVPDEESRDEADVVLVLEGAGAELALPLRVGEVLVSHRGVRHALLRGIDRAGAQREGEPAALRIAQIGRDVRGQRLGAHRLRDVEIERLLQAADVDGDQHVGWAVLALGLDALGEALLGEDGVDLDAGRLGELVERRRIEPRLAVGVDVDDAFGMSRKGGAEGRGGERTETGASPSKMIHDGPLRAIEGSRPSRVAASRGSREKALRRGAGQQKT